VEHWLTTPPFVASLREKIRNWVNLKPRLLCPMRRRSQVADQVMGRLMEGTMLSTRIGIAGACFLLCAALAVAHAAAQTQAAGAAGKPLSLLQFIRKNGEAKLRPHSETAAKSATSVLAHRNERSVRRMVAESPAAPHLLASNLDSDRRKLEKPTVEAPQASAPEMPAAAAPKNVWPAADPAAATQPSILTPQPALTPQPGPASISNEAVVGSAPNEIFGAGAASAATTAQPAANATRSAPASPQQPTPAKPIPPAPMKAAQATAPENQVFAETAEAAPAVRAMATTPAYQDTDPVGSASWIAHVLAALGGACAAGAIAWLLISPTSRTVG
jgi:hypothetical protein